MESSQVESLDVESLDVESSHVESLGVLLESLFDELLEELLDEPLEELLDELLEELLDELLPKLPYPNEQPQNRTQLSNICKKPIPFFIFSLLCLFDLVFCFFKHFGHRHLQHFQIFVCLRFACRFQ